jgi:hypothetical protein
MTKTDFQLSAGYNIKFGDGSIQSVVASLATILMQHMLRQM